MKARRKKKAKCLSQGLNIVPWKVVEFSIYSTPEEQLHNLIAIPLIYCFYSKVTLIIALQLESCFSNRISFLIAVVLLN